ncbi:hypothetical protein [Flavobacterium sp. ACN6]|nr:hypothetical protein [Flavobacterium sp. ACN6]
MKNRSYSLIISGFLVYESQLILISHSSTAKRQSRSPHIVTGLLT